METVKVRLYIGIIILLIRKRTIVAKIYISDSIILYIVRVIYHVFYRNLTIKMNRTRIEISKKTLFPACPRDCSKCGFDDETGEMLCEECSLTYRLESDTQCSGNLINILLTRTTDINFAFRLKLVVLN